MLEDSRWPIVLVDDRLDLVWANKAARLELEAGDSFRVDGEQLTLGSETADEDLRKFLGHCDENDRAFAHSSSEGDPILARCRTVRSDTAETIFALSFFRPSEKPENIEPPLAVIFGLTATEERVLSMLGEGSNADCIADVLGVSIATVRKHISNAYRKIGVRSREELFARLRTYS